MNKLLLWIWPGLLGGIIGIGAFLALNHAHSNVPTDIKAIHTQVNNLETVVAAMKSCACANNGPTPNLPVLNQWYQSQTNPNMQYWGYVKDDVLYYYYYKINDQIISTGAGDEMKVKKTTDFVKK